MADNITRRNLLAAGGGLGLAGLLAACGSSDTTTGTAGGSSAAAETTPSSSAAATSAAETSAAATSAAAGPKFDPESESGDIKVFEWPGYELPEMWQEYIDSAYHATSPLKFSFLDDDQQALAKVASGYEVDITHPCIAYTKDWADAGLIQPWDLSFFPDFDGIPAEISAAGAIDGQQYMIPFDIGFSSLVYRADKITFDGEPSWDLLLNEAYKGKMSLYSDSATIIKIGGLINSFRDGTLHDPNELTDEEVAKSAETMKLVKKNLRDISGPQKNRVDDFINGNVWATYVWPDGYWAIKNHEKMKGVDIQYMWPKEGRLAWVCGLVLGATTKVPGRASLAAAAANTPRASAWLTDAYQYGGAQQKGVKEMIKDQALIPAFSLDDPAAFAPPRSWPEKVLANRTVYLEAGEAVKAS